MMNIETEFEIIEEPLDKYKSEKDLFLKEETFKIIGACFEVHKELGKGFLEVVYKDALEIEFHKQGIFFEREKRYDVYYKDVKIPHFYYADFVVFDSVILEIKAQEGIVEDQISQVLNYLAVSKCKLGLIVNFGEKSLKFKRIVL